MDHVQQILLQQLRGAGTGSGTGSQQTELGSGTGSNFDSSVDWAEKAKQWAEEQRKQKILEERRNKQIEQFIPHRESSRDHESSSGNLQGWKDEHPSWFRSGGQGKPEGQWPDDQPGDEHHRRSSFGNQQNNFNQNAFQAKFIEFQENRINMKSQKKNRNRQNSRKIKKNIVGTFPDFPSRDAAGRNLPKWMQDEIERLQAKQADGEQLEEKDEQNLSELQQLADREDSNSDSSEDDWKIEGRKISEDLAKANSKSDSEDSSVEMQEELTLEIIDRLKNEVMAATMKSIFLKVTDQLTGKICRNVFSKASSLSENEPKSASSGLGGLIGYGKCCAYALSVLIYAYARQSPTGEFETDSGVSDDSDDASQDGDVDAGDDSSDNDSVSSEVIRKKRKKFEKVQKRRLKLLRLKRGKTNLFKFDFRLDSLPINSNDHSHIYHLIISLELHYRHYSTLKSKSKSNLFV
jgi:hypothetical protein